MTIFSVSCRETHERVGNKPVKTLWINAGELSGDVQGGALLAALRGLAPDLRVVGMGGDNLDRAGQDNLFRMEEL